MHNNTHMPFRAWCSACVAGKAHDRPHYKRNEQEGQRGIPEIVFDYGFLGAEDEEETMAVQIAKDNRTKMFWLMSFPAKVLLMLMVLRSCVGMSTSSGTRISS